MANINVCPICRSRTTTVYPVEFQNSKILMLCKFCRDKKENTHWYFDHLYTVQKRKCLRCDREFEPDKGNKYIRTCNLCKKRELDESRRY